MNSLNGTPHTTNQQQPVAEKAQQKSETPNIDKLPADIKAQALEHGRTAIGQKAMGRVEEATQHRPEHNGAPNTQGDTREALLKDQGTKGKTQQAMSPTDSGKSVTQSQQRQRGRGIER
jgi:hypothetical protein